MRNLCVCRLEFFLIHVKCRSNDKLCKKAIKTNNKMTLVVSYGSQRKCRNIQIRKHRVARLRSRYTALTTTCIAIGLIYGISAATAKLKPIDSISNNGMCNARYTRIRRISATLRGNNWTVQTCIQRRSVD